MTSNQQVFTIGIQHGFVAALDPRTRQVLPWQCAYCGQQPRAQVHNMESVLRMSCENAHCEQAERGWVAVIDPLDREQLATARFMDESGRHFLKLRSELALEYLLANGEREGITLVPQLRALLEVTEPGKLVYLFFPGQPCLKGHIDNEVVFQHDTVRGSRIHERPEDFTEHMNEEADRVGVLRA